MFTYDLTDEADRRIERITRRNPRMGESLIRKIEWLAQNAETVAHRRLEGSAYFSLHSASYRIIYELLLSEQRIVILDIGQHDEVYKRVNRLK